MSLEKEEEGTFIKLASFILTMTEQKQTRSLLMPLKDSSQILGLGAFLEWCGCELELLIINYLSLYI